MSIYYQDESVTPVTDRSVPTSTWDWLSPEDRKLVRVRVAQRWTDADGKPLYRINDSGNICRTRQLTTKKKYAIKERDGYCCQSCGRHDPTGGSLQVDHIIAYRLGGSDHPSNLQTLCKPCHVEKERQSRLEVE